MAEEQNKNQSLEQERFPPNSYTDIKPKEAVAKRNGAPQKKKAKPRAKQLTLGERIAESFLMADRNEIKDRIVFEWIIPMIKNMLEDTLHVVLHGGRGSGSRARDKRSENGRVYTSYDRAFEDARDERREGSSTQNFSRLEFRFRDIRDAEQVQDDLREELACAECGYVTVKSLFNHDYIQRPTNYKMGDWGWYDLDDIDIAVGRGEYILRMPKAVPIRRR